LTVVPFVTTSPLVGAGAGVAAVGGFRFGPRQTTSFSSVEMSALTTTNGQSSLTLRSAIRLPDDDWVVDGDWSLGQFPNPAWGVGGDTPDSNETTVDRKVIKVHETAYRRIGGGLYAGLGYYLDDVFDIVDRRAANGEETAFSAYGTGTSGRSFSSALAASVVWDTRDNPLNPSAGSYALLRYRWAPVLLASDTTWSSVWLEGRTYLPLGRPGDTLGLWAFGWVTYGQPPYLMLPAIGLDPRTRSGRGWIEARHVGRDLVGLEAEYRFRIWEFVGAVVGANVHSASEREDPYGAPDLVHWKPAAVAGLRFMLNRQSQANVVLDFALHPGGNLAVYLEANEAF
jgi:hypothetical protein